MIDLFAFFYLVSYTDTFSGTMLVYEMVILMEFSNDRFMCVEFIHYLLACFDLGKCWLLIR